MAYSPRKRARSEVPRFRAWPNGGDKVKIQGFAGYKAGMTHALVRDYRPTSTTSGQEVRVSVTVLEVPPMKVLGVRTYVNSEYGMKTHAEIWADKIDEEVSKRLSVPAKAKKPKWKTIEKDPFDDIRLICHTQPQLITGIPKKIPDIMELRVGGGTIEDRIELAKSVLGKEIKMADFNDPGAMVDVAAVTKGKGFQGHVKRWGVKLLTHKNSKHRRMIGTLGPWHPNYVMSTVPQAGQMGYHQRTEFNKRILKIGDDAENIMPKGGFLHYGSINNDYVIIHGSVPGPTKRLVRFRDAVRFHGKEVSPELTFISVESKQGR